MYRIGAVVSSNFNLNHTSEMENEDLAKRYLELWKGLLKSDSLEIEMKDGYHTSIFILRDKDSKKDLELTCVFGSNLPDSLAMNYGGLVQKLTGDKAKENFGLVQITKATYDQYIIGLVEEEIGKRNGK